MIVDQRLVDVVVYVDFDVVVFTIDITDDGVTVVAAYVVNVNVVVAVVVTIDLVFAVLQVAVDAVSVIGVVIRLK